MAFESIEASYIGDQLKLNIARMVSNMRDNANGYKAAISSGQPASGVGVIMKADAGLFLARMQIVVVNSLRTTLAGVCDHVIAATLNNGAQVNAEADFILANVPIFERIF